MNLNLILEAALVSVLMALPCFAAGFAALRAKLHAERAQYQGALKEQAERVETLRKQLESYGRRLIETEQRHAPAAESPAFPHLIHLNRRGQVVQLHRRGENVRNIASSLGMSQGEVKLMIKLHEMSGAAALKKI